MTNSTDPGKLTAQSVVFKSSDKIVRYAKNPILIAEQVPFPCNLAFNAGVEKFNGLLDNSRNSYFLIPYIYKVK